MSQQIFSISSRVKWINFSDNIFVEFLFNATKILKEFVGQLLASFILAFVAYIAWQKKNTER